MVLNIVARPEAKRAVYCVKALGCVSETKRQVADTVVKVAQGGR